MSRIIALWEWLRPKSTDETDGFCRLFKDIANLIWPNSAKRRRNRQKTWRRIGGVLPLLLTACATDYASVQDKVIVNDRGGYVMKYALAVARDRESGEPVRIMGRCASACTLYLSLPNVCIGPRAYFQFHAPYGSNPKANQYVKEYMMKEYPAWVRNWINKNGGLSRRLLTMSGKAASRHVRRCG